MTLAQDVGAAPADAPIILILGETGAGKSSFINKLAPGSVKVGHDLTSCTVSPQLVEANVGTRKVLLVDTPGFSDTHRSDTEVLREIAGMLTLQMQLGVKLRGVLYLHDICSPRMTGSSIRQLGLLQRICGPENFQNVILVTTKWQTTTGAPEEFQTGNPVRERDLRRLFWAPMIVEGSRMMRFDGRKEMAEAIVRSLLEKNDAVLALQQEMLIKRKSLESTAAGSYVVQVRRDDESELHNMEAKKRSSTTKDADLEAQIKQLEQSLRQRKHDEEQLKEDIVERVDKEVHQTVKRELQKNGRRPTVVNIISWLIGICSIGISVALTA